MPTYIVCTVTSKGISDLTGERSFKIKPCFSILPAPESTL